MAFPLLSLLEIKDLTTIPLANKGPRLDRIFSTVSSPCSRKRRKPLSKVNSRSLLSLLCMEEAMTIAAPPLHPAPAPAATPYPFTAPAVSPCTIRRWKMSTIAATGTVATTAAARISPHGTWY